MEVLKILDRERNIAMETKKSPLGDSVGERNWKIEKNPRNLARKRDREIDTTELVAKRDDDEEIANPNAIVVLRERKKREKDSPPTGDCCPICFDSFNIDFKTDCGHWYCGGCILQYWKYSAGAIHRCKCPICTQPISKFTPEASLNLRQEEEEVIKVLKGVQEYNRLFVGGALGLILLFWVIIHGLILKLLRLPSFIKRSFQGLLDPDRVIFSLDFMRFIVLFLGIFYRKFNLDFIPLGYKGIEYLFDFGHYPIVLILYWVGMYRR